MIEKLQKLKEEALESLSKVKDLNSFREIEVKYLGRKGDLTNILRGVSELGDEEKRKVGKLANDIKLELFSKFEEVRNALEKKGGKDRFIDVTLPGKKISKGHLHPTTIVQNDLEDLFISLGFMVLDGPELESDYYNFEALNIPKYHPARDMQDTFYIDKKNAEGESDLVMRTHTTSMLVRSMHKYGVPLKAMIAGRCFRNEATDVRHEHTFYQMDGFMIDKEVNLSHLKGILETVAKHLYGPETKVRMRPKFYPFVEPGTNGEVTCFLCHGAGCRLCKYSGWLEIFGCGMIHPNVLRAGGIDPKEYSGYAFGFGLSRVVQLKYGIEDVRLFQSGDLRFLEQF